MSNKNTKRLRSTDSPKDGNGSPEVTLDLIYQQLMSVKTTVSSVESKLEGVVNGQIDHSNRISLLEEENSHLRRRVDFLEQESNRYKVRIIDPAISVIEFNSWKSRVLEMVKTAAKVEESSIRHVALFSSTKGANAILTLVSSQQVNAICSQSKAIFEKFKLRVARELTQVQRAEMNKYIDEAKVGKSDPRISVNLALPVAFVDDVKVWPPNQRRRPGVTYANAASPKPMDIYKLVDPAKATIISPIQPLVSDSAVPVSGNEFIGFAFHWNGKDNVQSLANDLISNAKVPFLINQEKDNIIFASVALDKGNFCFSVDDGHEQGAASNFLKILAERQLANIAIIIFRKYGGTKLYSRRYGIYNGIVKRLLEKLDASGQGDGDE